MIAEKTFGECFLLEMEETTTKGLLFALLEKTFLNIYPQKDLEKEITKVSDFGSVATYQGKLAKIRIDYNTKAINDIKKRLVGLVNFGEDNYKYKEKIIRKLNLLIRNYPTSEEIIYLVIAHFIQQGYGTVEDFKIAIKEHIKANSKEECAS